MTPVEFDGMNSIVGVGQPQYRPLPTMRHKDTRGKVTSCWKGNIKERFIFLLTGRMYLTLITFNNPIQPSLMSTEFPIKDY